MEYMYDVFKTCEAEKDTDLTISLAKFISANPDTISHGEEEKSYREFIGKHYMELVVAYKLNDREAFDAAIAGMIAADEEA